MSAGICWELSDANHFANHVLDAVTERKTRDVTSPGVDDQMIGHMDHEPAFLCFDVLLGSQGKHLEMSLRRGWLIGEDWRLVRASSVFEVECEVGIREVWPLLHEMEILAG